MKIYKISRLLTSLALPLAVLCTTNSFASDGLKNELYSRINVNAQLSDEGADSFSEIKSNNSWIGVKGGLEIDDDLSVIYKLEWKVDITGESGSDSLTPRPQFVGLQSKKLGTVTIGRSFTPVWAPGRALDLFNHYEGDIKALWKGENRISDSITYVTPSFNNFRIETLYEADKSEDGESSVSSGLFYGDRKLKKTNLYGGIAHDFGVNGYDVTRIFGRYKFGAAMVGVLYQQQEPENQGDSKSGILVNMNYQVDNIQYKIQYQTLEDDTNFNLGLDYNLTKKFKLYAWLNKLDKEETEDSTYIALGMEYQWSMLF